MTVLGQLFGASEEASLISMICPGLIVVIAAKLAEDEDGCQPRGLTAHE